jgi:hypothetical protein
VIFRGRRSPTALPVHDPGHWTGLAESVANIQVTRALSHAAITGYCDIRHCPKVGGSQLADSSLIGRCIASGVLEASIRQGSSGIANLHSVLPG